MRIKSLRFSNFRQFAGDQEIRFSDDTQRNVSLVFGTNGAGKTTILNAIQWVLYGDFSDDFEQHERLVNDGALQRAVSGASASCYAELTFEHGGSVYTMRRSADVRLVGVDQKIQSKDVTLHVTDRSGANTRVSTPTELIRQMFPEQLARFYFFNGERLAANAGSGFSRLGEQIKFVTGLVKFERAIRHLPQVRHRIHAELENRATSQGVETLSAKLLELSDKQADLEESIRQGSIREELIREKIGDLQETLRNNDLSRELQLQRDQFNREYKDAELRMEVARGELKSSLNSSSALPFMVQMAERTVANSEQLRERGELPRAIRVQFIDDLLAEARCICGAELSAGSTGHQKVSEWRMKAGHAESEEAWIKAAAFGRSVAPAATDFTLQLRRVMARIRLAEEEQRDALLRIGDVDRRLRGIDQSEIQRAESELAALDQDLSDEIRKHARSEQDLESCKREIESIKARIDESAAEDARALLVAQRLAAIDHALDLLKKEYRIRSESVRRQLEEGINKVYRNVIIHDYHVEVDEDFVLTLWRNVDGVKTKAVRSTAETHALYLSFIAQLSDVNRRMSDRIHGSSVQASEQFPLVMDASFGNFDAEPKRRLADALPRLTHQVILLVSKDQGQGVVEETVDQFTGRKAVLTLYSRNADGKTPVEEISINGRDYPYVRASDTYDHSKVVEVL